MDEEEIKRQRRERLRQKLLEKKKQKTSEHSEPSLSVEKEEENKEQERVKEDKNPTLIPFKRESIGSFKVKAVVHSVPEKRKKARVFDKSSVEDDEPEFVPRKKIDLQFDSNTLNIENVDIDMDESKEIDPLDSYMKNVQQEVQKLDREGTKSSSTTRLRELDSDSDSDGMDFSAKKDEEEEDPLEYAMKKVKKNDLDLVDHETIEYEPFRKNFYVEAPDIARMSKDEVNLYRLELDNIKIKGQNCPKPIKRWSQCGLPLQCLHVIKELNFDKPTPIQAQALPAVMSGRDLIGIAKTGSGKTMAFVLPLFRHIKDQRPLDPMDGPIGLIMTPTRELALQIHSECKRIANLMGYRVACAYGGAPIKDQIAELKRGAEILVCTPGRLIDLLCANHGRVTNLKRITYLVLDECDRLFDFGFEQQIMRIVANVRPDSQRLLFSATFPKPVEALARKILKTPLEITVGVKSVVCSDVFQYAEVIEEDLKFIRLLEILGKWYQEAADQRLLIFVDRQEAAEELLRELVRRGYRCLCLHGGKDQHDRDKTLHDFKNGSCPIMIATSVAARGLDVPQLNIVINYDVPNHKEDYVHRVGRTGRAGRKGRSFTFITSEQERFAPAIYHAMLASGAQIPASLKRLHEGFMAKVEKGDAQLPSLGFGGKGLDQIEKEREAQRIAATKTYAEMEGIIDEYDGEEREKKLEALKSASAKATMADANPSLKPEAFAALQKAKEIRERVNMAAGMTSNMTQEVLKELNARSSSVGSTQYSTEIEINDYPYNARTRVTSQEFQKQITSMFECVFVIRGNYIPQGKSGKKDERKLHIMLEGKTRQQVEKAKAEVKRVLNESSLMMESVQQKRF